MNRDIKSFLNFIENEKNYDQELLSICEAKTTNSLYLTLDDLNVRISDHSASWSSEVQHHYIFTCNARFEILDGLVEILKGLDLKTCYKNSRTYKNYLIFKKIDDEKLSGKKDEYLRLNFLMKSIKTKIIELIKDEAFKKNADNYLALLVENSGKSGKNRRARINNNFNDLLIASGFNHGFMEFRHQYKTLEPKL